MIKMKIGDIVKIGYTGEEDRIEEIFKTDKKEVFLTKGKILGILLSSENEISEKIVKKIDRNTSVFKRAVSSKIIVNGKVFVGCIIDVYCSTIEEIEKGIKELIEAFEFYNSIETFIW